MKNVKSLDTFVNEWDGTNDSWEDEDTDFGYDEEEEDDYSMEYSDDEEEEIYGESLVNEAGIRQSATQRKSTTAIGVIVREMKNDAKFMSAKTKFAKIMRMAAMKAAKRAGIPSKFAKEVDKISIGNIK